MVKKILGKAKKRVARPASKSKESPGRKARPTLLFAPGLERTIRDREDLDHHLSHLLAGVVLTVTPTTRSKKPIQKARGLLHKHNLDDYRPDARALDGACQHLSRLGFEVLHPGRFGITVRAPFHLLQEVLGTKLAVHARSRLTTVRSMRGFGSAGLLRRDDLFLAPQESLSIRSRVSDHIDHLVFMPPPSSFEEPAPPSLGYPTLSPSDIRRLLNVPAQGATGAGTRVAVVDSGFYPHAHYANRAGQIRRLLAPGAANPDEDEIGHGTAIISNLFAVSPAATVIAIKYASSGAYDAALELAAQNQAQVVSISWGYDHEQSFPVLEATIRSLINDDGIAVLCASGNGEYSWPGSMPEVISVGGVFADPSHQWALEASDYTSGYMSSQYSGRMVPDVCGLSGQSPRGIYIPMPCQPGCLMDSDLGGSYPNGDGTGDRDGWVVASGSSSTTPQIAGVVALMLQEATSQARTLPPATVRDILIKTARSVQRGQNAFGFPASGQPNIASGYGLVNAGAALQQV